MLGELQQQAATDPLNVGTLLSWMSAHGQAAEARAWAANLPAPITQVPVVALRLAEANLRLADWAALESLTKDAQWGDVEILRLAFLCRALRETGQEDAAAIQWRAALANAKKNPSILPQTTDMLAAWGWGKERRELLWVAADLSKEVGWALRSLYQDYMAAGETNNLLRVATKMAELEPKSPDVQNNVACLLLLLNRHAVTPFATDSAFVSARDLYQRFPTDPRYVSTYAYALHVRGNSAEALKIMQTLRQEQLAEPATALYYGVLLSARGEVAEAAKYLALAAGNAKLLPEEKQLLEEARLAAR